MTPLHIAVKKDNIDIVKFLLSNPRIDVNIKAICDKCFLISFKFDIINTIQKLLFQWN